MLKKQGKENTFTALLRNICVSLDLCNSSLCCSGVNCIDMDYHYSYSSNKYFLSAVLCQALGTQPHSKHINPCPSVCGQTTINVEMCDGAEGTILEWSEKASPGRCCLSRGLKEVEPHGHLGGELSRQRKQVHRF